MKKPFKRFNASVGACVGSNDEIWTLAMNTDSSNTPIVMVHGFAAGLGFFVMNFEELSADRPLYAIDLPGFGRSSREKFTSGAESIEKQFVDSIEKWRQVMQIDRMILLGHSMGGFLISSYALRFPERVEHLILADPWGFESKPDNYRAPLSRRLKWGFFRNLAPVSAVRAAGPFGEWLIRFYLAKLISKFNALERRNRIATYMHQINCRNPTGEFAVLGLLDVESWPKHPMGERMRSSLSEEIPVTFLYGEKSQLNKTFGPIVKEARPASYTRVEIIKRSGHHVYVDNQTDFNRLVLEACEIPRAVLTRRD
jgi:pimeloyl-ACP methyl ester carboxylesterase